VTPARPGEERAGGPDGTPAPEGPHRRHRLAHLTGADDGLPIDPDLDPDDPAEPSSVHLRATVRTHRLHPATMVAIGAGGALGAWGRYELGLAWPSAPGGFPSSTYVVNTSGAFLLGLVLTVLVEHVRAPRARRHIRHFACVGVLGSWTTMSTFAMQSDALVRVGRAWLAVAYVVVTAVTGVAAVAAGIALGRVRATRSARAFVARP